MVKVPVFKGSCTAIVTPFSEHGVDYERLKKNLEFQYENGTSAVVVCGTTGENATHTPNEHDELVRVTVRTVNGRMKVIAGIGSNNTENALRAASLRLKLEKLSPKDQKALLAEHKRHLTDVDDLLRKAHGALTLLGWPENSDER